MRRVALVAVLIAVLARAALADSHAAQVWNGPLTRAQAIALATSQGFEVRIARAEARAASAAARGDRAGILPQLSVAGTASDVNMPQLGMPVARQSYVGVSLAVPLVNLPGAARARAGRFSAAAVSGDLSAATNDAAFAAVQAYDLAVLAGSVAAARRADVSEQRENVRVVALRVRAGKAATYVLAQARAALASAEQAQEDADARRDETRNDLLTLLDLGLRSRMTLADGLDPEPFDDTLPSATARALRQRPEIAAARSRVDAAASTLRAAKEAYAPLATLSAQTYNGASAPPLGAAGSQIGVTVSLPLIDGGARGAAVAQADAELAKAQIELERRELSVRRDVANAWRELTAARRNVETAQTGLVDAEKTLQVTQLRQRSGKGIQLEVLDALAVTANAREAVLRAQARFDIAAAALRRAAGDKL